jgi:glycosyltransferase involved in cell wall biosynthesis
VKNNKYLLTVCVVTYNHAQTILKTLESIASQKTDIPFIVKIYDDCSDDRTVSKIKNFFENHKIDHVLFEQLENFGAVSNFKRALHGIKTKYFTLIEGDDYFSCNSRFDLSIKALEKNSDCSMSAHNTEIISSEKTLDGNKKNNIVKNFFSNGIPNEGSRKFSIDTAPYFHFSSRTYRTFPINFESENEFILFDLFFYYKYLSLGNVFYIDNVMSVYRYNSKGAWSSLSKYQQKYKNIHMYLEMIVYFENKYFFFYNSITGNSKLLLRLFKTDSFYFLIKFSILRKLFPHLIIFYQDRFCKV